MIKVLGLVSVALLALGLYCLNLAEDKAALTKELTELEGNYRLQVAITAQVEQENITAMRGIERAQNEKNQVAADSMSLQRELAQLQADSQCLDVAVPVAVVERLRERVAVANAAAKSGVVAITGAHLDP